MENVEIFENSPQYFKNKFSNNCKMRLRYLSKLKNYFFNANNVILQYLELEKDKDPFSSKSELFKSIYSAITSINDTDLDELINEVQSELNEELTKDFGNIIQQNKEKYSEKQNEK